MEKMTREFLEEKGITDKEVINAILDKHHEIVKELKSDSEKITTLQTENDNLKKQIEERDKDLKELKKIDATEMQNKISELENKNKTQKEEYHICYSSNSHRYSAIYHPVVFLPNCAQNIAISFSTFIKHKYQYY